MKYDEVNKTNFDSRAHTVKLFSQIIRINLMAMTWKNNLIHRPTVSWHRKQNKPFLKLFCYIKILIYWKPVTRLEKVPIS